MFLLVRRNMGLGSANQQTNIEKGGNVVRVCKMIQMRNENMKTEHTQSKDVEDYNLKTETVNIHLRTPWI